MMIEKTLKTYLETQLDVPIYIGERPANASGEYVVVTTLDAGRINHIDAKTFDLASYSTSIQSAAELNAEVKTAMFNFVSIGNISSSKCGGGGQNIDTQMRTYCYNTIFNVIYTDD